MLTSMIGRTRGLSNAPWINDDYIVKPVGAFNDRRFVTNALSGPPAKAAELDPKTVEALRSLFAPAQVMGGAALGYSVR